MPDIVTSKHTIEVEVVVKWDLDPRGEYPHQFGIPSFVATSRWATSEQLEAFGITRPAPPYEPRIGDIVEYGNKWYRVESLARNGMDSHELVSSHGSRAFVTPSIKLALIARPEVKR
jgi:hypothetical protein